MVESEIIYSVLCMPLTAMKTCLLLSAWVYNGKLSVEDVEACSYYTAVGSLSLEMYYEF